MYSKIITRAIIQLQARGYSGEETKKTLMKRYGKSPSLHTIYIHRKSATGIEMLEALIEEQERAITMANEEGQRGLAMKYRDKLIKQLAEIIVPKRIETRSEIDVLERKIVVVAHQPRKPEEIESIIIPTQTADSS